MLEGAQPFSPAPGDPIWDNPRRPRYFDDVDTVTGTPEADAFEVELVFGTLPLSHLFLPPLREESSQSNEVEPLIISFYPTDASILRDLGRSPEPPKEQPETTEIVILDDGGRGECNSFGCSWIPFAEPLDDGPVVEEVDILVYQEKERANYLEGFQTPTARSYVYIESFDPIEDEIIVGGNPYVIEVEDNDIPMMVSGYETNGGEWGSRW